MQNIHENQYKTEIPMEQNIWNPKNWTFFSYVNFIFSLLLLIDGIIGLLIQPEIVSLPHLLLYIPQLISSLYYLPVFAAGLILLFSSLLNEKLDKSPFYTVIIIKIILYLLSIQYTLLGIIAEFILDLSTSIILVLILINITILENDLPMRNIAAMGLGIILVASNLFLDILVTGITENAIWGLVYLIVSVSGIFLIRQNQIKIGAIAIFIVAILNDYILFYEVKGFGVGTEILKFLSLLFFLYDIMRK